MLDAIDGRVLGSLIEKEHTVPDQYPLTVNALVLACNQSSSREPVMALTEEDVQQVIERLKVDGWLRRELPSHGRSVVRIRHKAGEKLGVDADGAAVLTVLGLLVLRGPSTINELRQRSERWYRFESSAHVESALGWLQERGHVQLIPRVHGQKEPRWQQLLAEEQAPSTAAQFGGTSAGRAAASDALAERVAALEARVESLETALRDLL